ncbi:hypothetical protein [Barrientosiimonas humi]|uniref:hypothetical protein n=1 Tax=Barrientosiimonas humi TaxID=999931 RepID=UPI00370D0A31
MIIAAILLLVIVAAIVLWVVTGADTSTTFPIDAAGISMDMNGLTAFILGAAAAVLAALALWMIKYGSKRGIQRRRNRKDLERRADEAEESRDTAIRKKDRADVEAARGRVAARDAERERDTYVQGDQSRVTPAGAQTRSDADVVEPRRDADYVEPGRGQAGVADGRRDGDYVEPGRGQAGYTDGRRDGDYVEPGNDPHGRGNAQGREGMFDRARDKFNRDTDRR